ncbi:MAG: hypothetical protein V4667_07545 [Bacteroidota bacterium]
MKHFKLLFCFCTVLCCFLTNENLFAQKKDSVIVSVDTVRIKQENKPVIYTIDGNKYRSPNSYFTIGAGVGYKINTPQKITSPVSMAFNIHMKGTYVQAGYLRSDVAGFFTSQSNVYMNELRLGIGKRKESLKNNLAFYVGANRATGQVNDSTGFTYFGLYTELQYTKKIFYDIGVGATLFGTYNKAFQMVGLRLEFYFSNALRKERN